AAAVLLATYWIVRAAQTLPAVALTPMLLRKLAGWITARPMTEEQMLVADGAGAPFANRRRESLARLADRLASGRSQASAVDQTLRDGFSDLRFTDASRVPFPFAGVMRRTFNLSTVVKASKGPYLQHVDGQWTLDVSGSYGLNVAGWD